mmetsp:Transcript_12533/g.41333  ORF Transcript_12533/g.41333 Transcript_12533/m.41333 type:complete len:489 (-) Transcript_12533:39-1505(-)
MDAVDGDQFFVQYLRQLLLHGHSPAQAEHALIENGVPPPEAARLLALVSQQAEAEVETAQQEGGWRDPSLEAWTAADRFTEDAPEDPHEREAGEKAASALDWSGVHKVMIPGIWNRVKLPTFPETWCLLSVADGSRVRLDTFGTGGLKRLMANLDPSRVQYFGLRLELEGGEPKFVAGRFVGHNAPLPVTEVALGAMELERLALRFYFRGVHAFTEVLGRAYEGLSPERAEQMAQQRIISALSEAGGIRKAGARGGKTTGTSEDVSSPASSLSVDFENASVPPETTHYAYRNPGETASAGMSEEAIVAAMKEVERAQESVSEERTMAADTPFPQRKKWSTAHVVDSTADSDDDGSEEERQNCQTSSSPPAAAAAATAAVDDEEERRKRQLMAALEEQVAQARMAMAESERLRGDGGDGGNAAGTGMARGDDLNVESGRKLVAQVMSQLEHSVTKNDAVLSDRKAAQGERLKQRLAARANQQPKTDCAM